MQGPLPLYVNPVNVSILHNQDIAKGFGEAYLPDALGRKYLNAAKSRAWQYVFHSKRK